MAIYVTEGYDETLVGTRNQIIEHIKDRTGMHVSFSNGSHTSYVIHVSESNENQTDVDVFADAEYTVTLTPATVLHDIGGNDEVVGMGFSKKAYEHPKSLDIDDMVIGDLFTIRNPLYDFERGFFEYEGSSEDQASSAFFIKSRTSEKWLLSLADIQKANLMINIEGAECHIDLDEYEAVMEILKRHRGRA